MKISNSNFIKVTIYKAKICSGSTITSYSLKMEFCKQIFETDKISSKDVEFGGKSYFFDLPPGVKPTNLEINANSKTLFIFDSLIAKVSIPINLNNLNDKREWYVLKNQNDENVISILTSIYCEIKSDKATLIDNSTNYANNSYIISKPNFQYINNINKNDLSYDMYRNQSNLNFSNMINKRNSNGNITYNNGVNNILNNINNSVDDERIDVNNLNNKLDHTVIYNDNFKSPDLSQIAFNIFSPNSNRLDQDKNKVNYNMLNISNLNSKLNNTTNLMNLTKNNYNNSFLLYNENLYLNTADSLTFDKWNEDNNEEQSEIVRKIKLKMIQIKEEKEKLKLMNNELQKNRDKLKQREITLIKEKEKLENHIKNFKSYKTEFENTTANFNQNYLNFNNELNKFKNEKETFNYEKSTFFNMNFLLSYGKYSQNIPEEKLNEKNHKISVNNVTFPNSTRITASSGSVKNISKNLNNDYNNSFKKEVILENPQNFCLNSSRITENTNSKIRRSNRASHDIPINVKNDIDKKLVNEVSNNTTSQNYNSGSISTDGNNIEISSNSKYSLYNSGNIHYQKDSKFYTPIAQINLNNKIRNLSNSNSSPSSNISNFDISSPKADKNIQENKLIDSLDNSNLLISNNSNIENIVNISNKKIKNNDEQKINKKVEDKKKFNMKYGNVSTTNNTYINSSALPTSANITAKDRDKKNCYPKNLDKFGIRKETYNSNSVVNNNINSISTKVDNLGQNFNNKGNQNTSSNSKLSSIRKKY